jgi:hypothetical protein
VNAILLGILHTHHTLQRHFVKKFTYRQLSTTPFSSNDTFTSRHNAIQPALARSIRITYKPIHSLGIQHLLFSKAPSN